MTSTIPPATRSLTRLVAELDKLLGEIHVELPPHAERRRLREQAGLSQAQFSRSMGVAERNVCNWEHPDRPEPTRTHRLLYRVALMRLAEQATSPMPAGQAEK